MIAVAVGSAFAATAFANPQGGSVAAGNATFVVNGKTLTITNAPGTIINWRQFSISQDEITRFIQQNASSAVLNRVVGQDPTQILGQLLSNGRVYLVNPNGMVFGKGAVIDVAGFAASTLNISNADFLSGKNAFNGTGLEGKITNLGTIRTQEGGHVYLIAPNVENGASGVISSPKGDVVIAAGKTVELVNSQNPDIRVEFTAPQNQAVNAGQIVANSGRIGIYGTLVRNSGLISASRAEVGDGGRIVLRGVKDVTLDTTSRIEANGAKGGSIEVKAETGTLLAQGTIEAKGEAGKGGDIALLGNRVAVNAATVDASGKAGGGTILIGGDYQGKNAAVQNAQRTVVTDTATIRADATGIGNGGKVIVWADGDTRFYGTVTARGGAQGGDGGFVEVSGKQNLTFAGMVDTTAPLGATGQLLLDPGNITITNNASVSFPTANVGPADGTWLFADDGGTDQTITSGTVLAILNNTNVNFQASSNITLTSGTDLNYTNPGGGANNRVFTLTANNSIDIQSNANVRSTGGSQLEINLLADNDANGTGTVTLGTGSLLQSSGGNIKFVATDIVIGANATVNAGSGGVVIYPSQATRAIKIGGGTSSLGLDQAEISSLRGSSIKIGSPTHNADITVETAITFANLPTVVLQTGQTINVKNGNALSTSGGNFVAQAGKDILISAAVSSSGGRIHLEADSPHMLNGADSTGQIKVNSGSPVSSIGGDIVLVAGASAAPSGGFVLNSDVNAGSGNISVSVSRNDSTLDFYIGSGGTAQFSTTDTGSLKSTGTLTIGAATSAGNNGLGADAVLLKIDSLTVLPQTSGLTLGSSAGSTVMFTAGNGGITLNNNVTTSQNTVISTSGNLTVNGTLNTSNNSLSISADTVTIGSGGSINTGTGNYTCTAAGCTLENLWNVDADGNWLTATNWSLGHVPTSTENVVINRTAGNFVVTLSGGGLAYAARLQNSESIVVSGSTLNISLASTNNGSLALTSGTILGAGSLTNYGTLTANGTSSVSLGLTNASGATMTVQGGTLQAGAFSTNAGTLNVVAGATFNGGGSSLTSSGAIQSAGNFAIATGVLSSSGSASFGGTFNAGTLSISGGSVAFNGSAGAGTLNLSGGAVTGTGNLTVSSAWSQGANTSVNLGGALNVTQGSGNLVANGNLSAGNAVLVASAGDLVLNAAVSGNVSGGDSVVLAASGNFVNNFGNAAVTVGAGRFLIYSTSPAGSTEGGLTAVAAAGSSLPRLYGRTYSANPPSSVSEAGSHLIYSQRPSLSVTPDGKTKVYGTSDPAQTYVASGFVTDDGVTDSATSAGLGGAFWRTSGEAVGTYAINAGNFASAAGYNISVAGTSNLVITPAALTVSLTGNATKTYGTSDPLVMSVSTSNTGLVSGATVTNWMGQNTTISDTVSVASLTRNAGENAGSYAITGGTLNVSAPGNYNASLSVGTSNLVITPAALTVSLTGNATKTYGTNDPLVTSVSKSNTGLVSGATVTNWMGQNTTISDTVSVASLTRNAGENAGSYAITGGTLNVSAPGNYNSSLSVGTSNLVITPASLTVSLTGNATKTYGTSDPLVTNVSTSNTGLVSATTVTNWMGQNTSINDTASVASLTRNAGENAGSYAITGGTLNVSAPGNYNSSLSVGALNLVITPASLTVSLTGNATKTYGTSDPLVSTVSTSNTGLVSGATVTNWMGQNTSINDTASVASLTRNAGENAGSYAITGGTLNVSAPSNYNASLNVGTANLVVAKAALAVSLTGNATKTYGTSDPLVSSVSTSNTGLVSGATVTNWMGQNTTISDTVSVATLTRSAGENAGSYAITGGTLNVSAPGNYNASLSVGTSNLVITPAALTVSLTGNATKTYGTNDPLVSSVSTSNTGLVSGATVTNWMGQNTSINDTASVASLTRNAGESAGSYAITGGTLNVSAASNYNASLNVGTANLVITPAALTVSLTGNATKTYGTGDPLVSTVLASNTGLVNGATVTNWMGQNTSINDTVSVASLTRNAGENAGSYAITGGTLNVSAASNYNASLNVGTANLVITKAALAVTLTGNASKTYGTNDPLVTSVSTSNTGLVSGATVTNWMGQNTSINDTVSVATLTRSAGENAGSYAITGGTLNVSAASNYNASLNVGTANLVIIPAALTVSLTGNATKTYGTNDPLVTSVSTSNTGLVSGATVTNWMGQNTSINDTASVASLTRNAGENAGSYAITGGTLNVSAPSNYNASLNVGTANLVVAKAALAVSLTGNATKTYGTSDPLVSSVSTSNTGLVSGATVTNWMGQNTTISDTVSVASLTRNAGENAGSYAITGGTLNVSAASNYNSSLNVGTSNLVVTKAALTITANNASKDYGQALSFAGTEFASSGLAAGTVSTWNGNVALSDAIASVTFASSGAASSAKAGSYAIVPSAASGASFAPGNYTITYANGTLNVVPTTSVAFSWNGGSDLRWDNPANWNQGAVPLNDPATVVTIPGGLGGAIVYSSSGAPTSLLRITSGSGLTISGGTINLFGTGTNASTFSGRPLTLSGGTLGGNGTLTLSGTTLDILAGGVLAGTRTINGSVNNLAGLVRPGNSPGAITITGNYVQGASGRLEMELGGTAAGSQYDQLVVGGTATLDGTLAVTLVNGFSPAATDLFTVVQAGSVSGRFSTVSLPTLVALAPVYTASTVRLDASGGGEVNLSPVISPLLTAVPSTGTTATPTAPLAGAASDFGSSLNALPATAAGTSASSLSGQTYLNVQTQEAVVVTPSSLLPNGVYVSEQKDSVLVVSSGAGIEPLMTVKKLEPLGSVLPGTYQNLETGTYVSVSDASSLPSGTYFNAATKQVIVVENAAVAPPLRSDTYFNVETQTAVAVTGSSLPPGGIYVNEARDSVLVVTESAAGTPSYQLTALSPLASPPAGTFQDMQSGAFVQVSSVSDLQPGTYFSAELGRILVVAFGDDGQLALFDAPIGSGSATGGRRSSFTVLGATLSAEDDGQRRRSTKEIAACN